MVHMSWPLHALLGVEAKMYDRVDSARLGEQLRYQQLLLEHIATGLGLALEHVHHVGLLPEQLAHQVGDLGLPVVTWEQVFAEYSDVAPPYWLDVLDHALSQYDALVSKYSGPNAEFQIDGHKLVDRFRAGGHHEAWLGRKGGLLAALTDVTDGSWCRRTYECRLEALPGNPNWFLIADFIIEVEAKWPPLVPGLAPGIVVRGRPSGWNSPNRAVSRTITSASTRKLQLCDLLGRCDLPPLEVFSPDDRAVLEAWCRAGTVEARVAKRARIVLLAAEGPFKSSDRRAGGPALQPGGRLAEAINAQYGLAGLGRLGAIGPAVRV